MKPPISPETRDAALKAPSLESTRLACMILTLSSAFFVGLPIFLAGVAPRALPPIEAEAPSLDPVLGLCALLELAAFAGSFLPHRFWRRLALRRPAEGQPWQPEALASALGRAWLLRYLLNGSVCVAAGLGLFLGYQQGLLPASPRLWLLALLPVAALLWMLRHWPDEAVLRKAFFNS